MAISPLAGKLSEPASLVNVPRLITAYYTGEPDTSRPEQRIAFGLKDILNRPGEFARELID